MHSRLHDRLPRVAVAGAGPAGTSAAIRLALRGFDVTLIERETFPRHKLCGEFISPECLGHFQELDVLEQMLDAGGHRIYETRFFDRRGRSFSVPSSLFDGRGFGLSLSRSTMDHLLLARARAAGVTVIDGTRITGVTIEGDSVRSIVGLNENGEKIDTAADLVIDATGRSSILSRLARKKMGAAGKPLSGPTLAVGFKNHFLNAGISPGTCEIYAFPGGYGGLTAVENGRANLCFLIDPKEARRLGADAQTIVTEAVIKNCRAAEALSAAQANDVWLAVSIASFGQNAGPLPQNLFTVGDSAAFIDPFTGSGMLMAMESSALLSGAILERPGSAAEISRIYLGLYRRTFSRRLRVCSLLRPAAYLPFLPTLAIAFLRLSKGARRYVAAGTRSPRHADHKIR